MNDSIIIIKKNAELMPWVDVVWSAALRVLTSPRASTEQAPATIRFNKFMFISNTFYSHDVYGRIE